MADIFSRLSRLKPFLFKRFKSKIKPIEDKNSSSETTSVSQNSLKERNIVSEDNYRRDSFDDQFCDDLCEVLLQFLSFEDKLRLECVSKQFQRTVFQRHHKLYFNIREFKQKIYLNKKEVTIRGVFTYYYFEDQSFHSFKALLKKCPNITSIQMNGTDNSYRNFFDIYTRSLCDIFIDYNPICCLMEQMANYCPYLKIIECGFVINDKNLNIRQLLSQLKAFPALKRFKLWLYLDNEVEDNIDVNQLFVFEFCKHLSNITHLSFDSDKTYLTLYFDHGITLKKLSKEVDINLPIFQFLKVKDIFDTTPEGVTQIAEIISRLKARLKTRILRFKSEVDYQLFIQQIIKNCRKIEINLSII